jgi:antitoxin HicB
MESDMARTPEYPFEVRPLTAEEGGGYLISFPDFADCVSDGATVDEAIENGRLALKETIAALRDAGPPIPEPTAATGFPRVSMPSCRHAPERKACP